MNLRTIVIAGSLASLLAGCGGSSKDAAGSAGPASTMALCQGLGNTFATRLLACSGGGAPEAYLNLLLAVELNCENFQDAQAAGRVAFDQAKAKACLDTLGATSCGQLLRGSSLFPEACYEALAPRVAAGGLCTSAFDIECVAGFCDNTDAAACTAGGRCVTSATLGQPCSGTVRCARGLVCGTTSVCEAPPVITLVGLGADCTASTTACNDGLFCDGSVTPRVCAAPKGLSANCAAVPCEPGLRCDSVSQTCATIVALGATCEPGKGQCAGNAYCGPGNKCLATPVLGADCTPVAREAIFCLDSWCKPAPAPATTAACAPYTAPGAACDTGNLLQCGLGHACTPVSGTTGVCGRNYCGPV